MDHTEFDRWVVRRAEARKRFESLAKREQQVLKFAFFGYTAKAAAKRLQLSIKTIEKYRTSLMRKLKVGSMYQAVSLYTLCDFEETDV